MAGVFKRYGGVAMFDSSQAARAYQLRHPKRAKLLVRHGATLSTKVAGTRRLRKIAKHYGLGAAKKAISARRRAGYRGRRRRDSHGRFA